MEEKPKIYLVRGVDREKPNPFDEYMLYASIDDGLYDPYCKYCNHSFDINSLQLYCMTDSMAEDHSNKTAFIEGDADYYMISYQHHARKISELISGAVASRIGFGESADQVKIEKEHWLTTPPFLSRLQVTGRCYNALNSKGEPLPKCNHCNRIKDVVWMIIEDTNDILLDYDQWDGTDVFRLYGTYNPILTENAVNILNELGFDNLALEELHWYQ